MYPMLLAGSVIKGFFPFENGKSSFLIRFYNDQSTLDISNSFDEYEKNEKKAVLFT